LIQFSPKSRSKSSTKFLLDIDTNDTSQLDLILAAHNMRPLSKHKTKNGYHYLVKPFNRSLLEGNNYNCSVKPDALLFLNHL